MLTLRTENEQLKAQLVAAKAQADAGLIERETFARQAAQLATNDLQQENAELMIEIRKLDD